MKSNKFIRFDGRAWVNWMFRGLYGVAIAVLSYFFFSLFFDTPIEYEIKKSTQKLEQQYEILNRRYDSVHSVLENIIHRDKGIHQVLFESEPYDGIPDSTVTSVDEMLEKSNMELGDELISRTGQLYQRIYNVDATLESIQQHVANNRAAVNAIPAIQPIENRDLSLLAASFGNRINPYYKTTKMHKGVDYAVPEGTAVYATADGVVTEIQNRGQTSGTSISIRHSSIYTTFYGNLYHTFARPGQRIKRGEIIAFSGNTGLSFAPHLHYEVRYKGKAVDPLNYFYLDVPLKAQERLRQIAAGGMQSFD